MTSLVSPPQADGLVLRLAASYRSALCDGRCAVGSRDCWSRWPPGPDWVAAGWDPRSLLAATNWQAISTARLASSGVRTVPAQDGGFAGHLGANIGPRQQALQHVVEALEVGADRDLERQDLLVPGCRRRRHWSGPEFPGDQEDAVRGLHDGVDLVRGMETSTSLSSNGNCTSICTFPVRSRPARRGGKVGAGWNLPAPRSGLKSFIQRPLRDPQQAAKPKRRWPQATARLAIPLNFHSAWFANLLAGPELGCTQTSTQAPCPPS